MSNLHFISVAEAAAGLRRRSISCIELAQHCLRRVRALQPLLNAFIAETGEQALAAAAARDAELAQGRDRGPLHGIPIAHKDLIDVAGVPTTAGTRPVARQAPARDAIVARGLADAGAIMLGKTNMNELAAGTSGKNVHHGDVHNPWDLERSAGGSSSGTAAALAAGLCLAGTGSDTGGSIRIPAACTGLVSLRPTYGSIPLEGVVLRSRSFDTIGPMARCVADCALVLQAMSACAPFALAERSLRGARLAVLKVSELEDEVASAFQEAIRVAAREGASVRALEKIDLAENGLLDCLMDTMLYEFRRLVRAAPDAGFGPVVADNLRRGGRISKERYDSCRERSERFARSVRKALEEFDALLLPTLAAPTPRLDAPVESYDRQRELTLPLSATGLPVLAIPCGRDGDGLPLGVQLAGRAGSEARLLALGADFERIVGWPAWRPPLARPELSQ